MGRGTFAIIAGLIVAVILGSFVGGRLSAQELLAIFGLFILWAFGVSLFRAMIRLRARFRPPPRNSDE